MVGSSRLVADAATVRVCWPGVSVFTGLSEGAPHLKIHNYACRRTFETCRRAYGRRLDGVAVGGVAR